MRSKQLGQLLVENGDVDADQVAQALKLQEERGGLLGYILREQNWCQEQAIINALLKQVQVTDVKCDELYVPPDVAGLVARETCEMEKLCPFERIGNMLCIVMGNPLNRKAISSIEETTKLKVKSFKAVWPKIHELIERTYSQEAAPAEELSLGGGSDDLSLSLETAEVPAIGDVPSLDLEEPLAPVPLDEPLDLGGDPAPKAIPASKGVPSGVSSRRLKQEPQQARIKGLDSLSDGSEAEMINTDDRGLTKRRGFSLPSPLPKAKKNAKVNVDLDTLDLSEGEVLAAAGDEQLEGHDEIAFAAPLPATRRILGDRFVELKPVKDAYFYDDAGAPAEKAEEFFDLIDSLPKAEVLAQSIGDFERAQNSKNQSAVAAAVGTKPSMAGRPIQLQPAPYEAVQPTLISEGEFQKLVGVSAEDPVGEWDWAFIAPGPVTVQPLEEN
jgi:hypothetical protein